MLARRQHDLLAVDLLVGHLPQQVVHAVEPRLLLVDRLHHPPARLGDVRALEHHFLGLGVVLPAAARLEVHRRELPLLERVVDAALEAQLLLLVGDREPVFDQLDPGAHEHALELGRGVEELLVLRVGAEAHHALDPGAVVPAAVEEHDLARGREVRHIALEIPLGALAVVGGGQGGDATHARIEALGDALDDAALACGVAPLEQDHEPVPGVDDPVLELHQLALEAEQLAEVVEALGAALVRLPVRVDAAGDPVVDLHLELLVEPVERVLVDPSKGLLARGSRLHSHRFLPQSFASILRRRSAMTFMICRAKWGVCWTMKVKRFSGIGTSVQSVFAVAVAVRGACSMSAISPITPPGPSESTSCPFTRSSTSPVRTTYMRSPGSPSRKMVCPAR